MVTSYQKPQYLPANPLDKDMSFFSQTKIKLFSNEPIIDFIDTLGLPMHHKRFLKKACVNPIVRMELDRLWRCLEYWGEDCRKKVEKMMDNVYWRLRAGR